MNYVFRTATICIALLASIVLADDVAAKDLLGGIVNDVTEGVTDSTDAVNDVTTQTTQAVQTTVEQVASPTPGNDPAPPQEAQPAPQTNPEPEPSLTQTLPTVTDVVNTPVTTVLPEPVASPVTTVTTQTTNTVNTVVEDTGLTEVLDSTTAPVTQVVEQTVAPVAETVTTVTEPLDPVLQETGKTVSTAVNTVDQVLVETPGEVVDTVTTIAPVTKPVLDPFTEIPPQEPVLQPIVEETVGVVDTVASDVVTPVTSPILDDTVETITDPVIDPVETILTPKPIDDVLPIETPGTEILNPVVTTPGAGGADPAIPTNSVQLPSNVHPEQPATGEVEPVVTQPGSTTEVTRTTPVSNGVSGSAAALATQPLTASISPGSSDVAMTGPHAAPDAGVMLVVTSPTLNDITTQATVADILNDALASIERFAGALAGQMPTLPAPLAPATGMIAGGASVVSSFVSADGGGAQPIAVLTLLLLAALSAGQVMRFSSLRIPSGILQTIPTPPG